MWTSPKRYIRTQDGNIVEASPGISGSLVVAEGSQLHEDQAREYGLMPPKGSSDGTPAPIGTVAKSIDKPTGKKPWIDEAGTERKSSEPSALPLGGGSSQTTDEMTKGLPQTIGSAGAAKK